MLLFFLEDGSAQMSKRDMVSYYKYEFLFFCTQSFLNENGWRDEICPWFIDGLDKKSYLEIDSMSSMVEELIWLEIDEITGLPRDDSGPFPSRDCVLKHCLDQYESKDMDKMAKRFAKRMKKIKPVNFRYH